MMVFNRLHQDAYRMQDPIRELMHTTYASGDGSFTSHRWLTESLTQRMIYYHMYGDLLHATTTRMKVLDIGGGFCSLTRMLVANHDYTLIDMMAHDDHEKIRETQKSLKKRFWLNVDWYEYVPDTQFDIVIANDLLPNVDQRLALFISKFAPVTREIRMLLTYYNVPRFYRAKRLDADEILSVLAWDGVQLKLVLEEHKSRIQDPNLEILCQQDPSLFANKRQVCMVRFRGDLAK